jgi:metal-dependent amidase/aminoacylase/carboxypeptidase family protein
VAPLGHICVSNGPVMANSDGFTINVNGIGGHGALPHHAVDAIVEASEVVMCLQSVISRNTVSEISSLSVCSSYKLFFLFRIL